VGVASWTVNGGTRISQILFKISSYFQDEQNKRLRCHMLFLFYNYFILVQQCFQTTFHQQIREMFTLAKPPSRDVTIATRATSLYLISIYHFITFSHIIRLL